MTKFLEKLEALILAILALHYPFWGKIEFYEKTRLYQLLDFTIIYHHVKKNKKKKNRKKQAESMRKKVRKC